MDPGIPRYRFPDDKDIGRVNDTLVLPQPKAVDRYNKRNAVLLRTRDTNNYTQATVKYIRN